MPLPVIDHRMPSSDHPLAIPYGADLFNYGSGTNWSSESSGATSSPFRQDIHHGLPMLSSTVSPYQLHSQPLPGPFTMDGTQDDMSAFILNESEGSLPSPYFQRPLAPFPGPSDRRKRDSRSRRSTNTPSQGHTAQHDALDHGSQVVLGQQPQQRQRRPLPSGSPNALRRGTQQDRGRGGTNERAQQPYQAPLQPCSILQSNGPLPKSGSGCRRVSPTPAATPTPAAVPTAPELAAFPPGQNLPGFVPIAQADVASQAQGNRWPISRHLLERIVAAERDLAGTREKGDKLTYKQIKNKYHRWKISESTLRGVKRMYELPKEHRERVPTWNHEHVCSLRGFARASALSCLSMTRTRVSHPQTSLGHASHMLRLAQTNLICRLRPSAAQSPFVPIRMVESLGPISSSASRSIPESPLAAGL